MNGYFIIIALVLAAAILAVLIAKLAAFGTRFANETRRICYEMDHADSYKGYRRWRSELRCHYLCLIPFVNKKNAMYVYRFIYRKGDHAKKKERKDSLAPLLLPSILGMCVCLVCICGMTWAWYSVSIQTPTQKLATAYYEVEVISVTGETDVTPVDGRYAFEGGKTYTVTLQAKGSVKKCGGYCLIEHTAGGIPVYTQTFKPEEHIVIQFVPIASGNYTFTGVWGSIPSNVKPEDILHAHTGDTVNSSTDNPGQMSSHISTQPSLNQSSGPSSQSFGGTYTGQPGDTLAEIAKKHNTTSEKLAAYNHIDIQSPIQDGQVLKIPPQDYVIPHTTTSATTTPTVTQPTNTPIVTPPSEGTDAPIT